MRRVQAADGQDVPRAARPAWHLVGRAHDELRLVTRALWQGVLSFYSSNNLTFASSIAYYALLSLLPFLLLILSLLGRVATDAADHRAVLDFVLRYFPGSLDFVAGQLDALRGAHVPLGIAGTALLVWAALGVFGAVTSAVDHAWRAERRHGFLKHKLISFLMLVAAGALLVVALVGFSAIGFVTSSTFGEALRRVPLMAWFTSLAVRWATTLLLIVVLALIYYFVPSAKVRFRDVWAGAIVAGVLWRGALEGFEWYLRDMSRLNLIHGSIATVVAFLLWVYVSAIILLYGVELSAACTRLRPGLHQRWRNGGETSA